MTLAGNLGVRLLSLGQASESATALHARDKRGGGGGDKDKEAAKARRANRKALLESAASMQASGIAGLSWKQTASPDTGIETRLVWVTNDVTLGSSRLAPVLGGSAEVLSSTSSDASAEAAALLSGVASVAVDAVSGLLIAATKDKSLVLYGCPRMSGRFGDGVSKLKDCESSTTAVDFAPTRVDISCSGNLVLALGSKKLYVFQVSAAPPAGARAASPAGKRGRSGSPARGRGRALWYVAGRPHASVTPECCAFSRTFANVVLSVETKDGRVRVRKYEYAEGALVIALDAEVPGGPAAAQCAAWSAQDEHCIIGGAEGALALFDCDIGVLKTSHVGRDAFTHLAWHPGAGGGGCILAAAGSHVCLLDTALNQLGVVCMGGAGRVPRPQFWLDVREAGVKGPAPAVMGMRWAPGAGGGGEAAGHARGASPSADAALVLEGGHLVVVRVLLGAAGGALRSAEIVQHHLLAGREHEALEVAALCSPADSTRALSRALVLDHLLRSSSQASLDMLSEAVNAVWSDVEHEPSPEKEHALLLARRCVRRLITAGRFEEAFAVGSRVGDMGALQDVGVAAQVHGEVWVARAAATHIANAFPDLPPEDKLPTVQELAELHAMEETLGATHARLLNKARSPGVLRQHEAATLGWHLEVEGRIQDAIGVYREGGLEGSGQVLEALCRADQSYNADVEKRIMALGGGEEYTPV